MRNPFFEVAKRGHSSLQFYLRFVKYSSAIRDKWRQYNSHNSRLLTITPWFPPVELYLVLIPVSIAGRNGSTRKWFHPEELMKFLYQEMKHGSPGLATPKNAARPGQRQYARLRLHHAARVLCVFFGSVE